MHRFVALALTLLLAAAAPAASTLLVFANDFQFPGGWMVDLRSGSMGARILRSPGTDINALTGVNVPVAGDYKVWVRTVDFPDAEPRTRTFAVAVNGRRLPHDAGRHGRRGWAWEPVGEVKIEAGETILEIIDVSRFWGRCDALLLSNDAGFDPNGKPWSALLKLKTTPITLTPDSGSDTVDPSATTTLSGPGRQVATLENAAARVRFFEHTDAQGATLLRRETNVRTAEGWVAVPSEAAAESLFVLHSPNKNVDTSVMHPRWNNPDNQVVIRSGGRTYRTATDTANPYRAGARTDYVARSATTLPDGSVQLSFHPNIGGNAATASDTAEPLTAVWRTAPGGGDFDVSVTVKALHDGFYSVGQAPFVAQSPKDVRFNLLPPLYQYQRAPRAAMAVPSSATPHPLSVIELAATATRPAITLGVAADPAELPFEWPNPLNARYGFALQSEDGRLQPAIFRPLLGLGDSRWRRDEARTLRWRILARVGDWRGTLAYATHRIFGVTDYRQPVNASLTDAALNIVELMRNETAAGWDRSLRGFWNIEGDGLATQASPLVLLSAAVLTDDEAFYVSHGLPAIEWTLTRATAHFARVVPKAQPPYVNDKDIEITSPSRFYGAAYWQGVHSLLGNANPWVADLVKRAAAAGPRQRWVPKFSDALALYRLDPSPEHLATAVRQAEDFVAMELNGRKTGDIGYGPFYNHDFIPVWWDLLALHELTGDARWLEAAETGGMLTVAGLRSHPQPTTPTVTVHPGGKFIGNPALWWRGHEQYRLGVPRKPGDVTEKQVPSWQVSPVGLGFEQPVTFYIGTGTGETDGFQHIMMSSWTPGLLRLHAATGKDVYRDFARGGIVGRFTNYPGYYLRGFTDKVHEADYPLKGPDITSIYYHHIPVHLAFTLDWLFAEAELRSKGAIKFPFGHQLGYVWFNSRIFGADGGEVFGDTGARPLLPRGVKVPDAGLNWIAARTADRLWIILMNDAPSARPATVELDAAALGLRVDQPVLVHTPGGEPPRSIAFEKLASSVSVPPRGLIALGFAATPEPEKPSLPPVAASPLVVPIGGDQGNVLAWRIRSPFGRDSIYVCLDGGPARKAGVELLLEEDSATEPRVVTRYPYEFSVHPIPVDKTVSFRIRITHTDGVVAESAALQLPGITPPEAARPSSPDLPAKTAATP